MASKIKNAIKEFLSGFSKLDRIDASEITDEVKEFSKSKTPEQSVNVALNALWKKGIIEKYYVKDGDIYKYPTDQPINKKYERLYRIREKEYLRKEISIDIYCGVGKVRKESIDVKMWTFEDNMENRENFLREKLLEYLQINYPDCYYVGENEYIKNTDTLDSYAYDDSQPTTNPPFVFPETDFEET